MQKLGDEKLSLDQSLTLYAKGVELARATLADLNTFKGKMELLDKQLKALEIETEDE